MDAKDKTLTKRFTPRTALPHPRRFPLARPKRAPQERSECSRKDETFWNGDDTSDDEKQHADDDNEAMEDAIASAAGLDPAQREDAKTCASLFKGLVFFLNREVPRDAMVFIIRAFGGEVCWEGEGSPYDEKDGGVTHHVGDRPISKDAMKPQREYVQRVPFRGREREGRADHPLRRDGRFDAARGRVIDGRRVRAFGVRQRHHAHVARVWNVHERAGGCVRRRARLQPKMRRRRASRDEPFRSACVIGAALDGEHARFGGQVGG